MTTPQASVVHCKKEPYDVYIGRPSKWGNPFTHREDIAKKNDMTLVESREEAVSRYEDYLLAHPELSNSLHELKGKVLGCWCSPNACHGDVLVKLIKEAE